MSLVADVAVAGLAVGASTAALPHGVSQSGVPLTPNLFIATPPWPLKVISVTSTAVVFRNDDPAEAYTGTVRCIKLHSEVAEETISAVNAVLSVIGLNAADKAAVNASLTKAVGTPMVNRLIANHGGVKFAQGRVVVVGADTYEFRDSTPPLGGTAGRIWVYNGANAAASRTNLIDAINNVVDATRITRTAQDATAATNTEKFFAAAGITANVINIVSVGAIGTPTTIASIAASDVATACSTTLTADTGTDLWDQATCYGGVIGSQHKVSFQSVTLTAQEIVLGNIQFYSPFVATGCLIQNRSRPQVEAYSIAAGIVSLILGGGLFGNNRAGDILDVWTWA